MPVNVNYNRMPQNDSSSSNSFISLEPPGQPWSGAVGTSLPPPRMNNNPATSPQSSSTVQTPPIPPRIYNGAMNTTPYNRGGFSNMSPYQQNPYGGYGGGGYMNSYGGNFMYRNNYYNQGYGYPSPYNSPYNNYAFPGSSLAQMAQNLFSPVFQNSDNMINTLRDVTCTADAVLVSIRMLFDSFHHVGNNLFRVRDFLQRYAVGLATLGSTHWIFKFIHQLLRFFRIFKKTDDSLWNKIHVGYKVAKPPSLMGNLMILTAFITAFSFVLPKLVEMIKVYVLQQKIETESLTDLDVWNPETEKYTLVQAKHDFVAGNASELTIKQGQQFRMKPIERSTHNLLPAWVLVADANSKKGYVPLTFLVPVN